MNNQKGVFSQNDLAQLITNGRLIPCEGFKQEHIGPASVDLTITGEAYRVKRLLQPSQLRNEKVRDLLPFMEPRKIELGTVVEVGQTVIAKASIEANFPPGMYGYMNAKSSSGRCFIFARTLADGVTTFDSIDRRDRGYTGEIWIVLQPLVFPFILTNLECYNQLRVFNGDTRFKQSDLEDLLREHDLLYRRTTKEPYKQNELSIFTHDGSVLTTLYAPEDKLIGFSCIEGTKPIDLTVRNLDPHDYFDPVRAKVRKINGVSESFVKVEGRKYYLFSTNEMVNVPETHSAELVALDPRLGFFFTHFAGFIDNGFFGTVTLEVFAPFDTYLRYKQPVGRFVFEKSRSVALSYKDVGNYHGQIDTRLAKQFLPW